MDLSSDIAEFEDETILANCQNLVQIYGRFKDRGGDEELDKTAKFWIMYLNLMKYQHMAHTIAQENENEGTCMGKYAAILYVTPHPSYTKFLAWYFNRYMNACNGLIFEPLAIAL